MNLILNVLWQHILAAVIKNWGYTVAGLIGSILTQGPILAQFFAGKDMQHVDYNGLWTALVPLLMGALGKSGINVWSVLTGISNSAPRAQRVG